MSYNVESARCKACKWCQIVAPKTVRGQKVDATCNSRWGASSSIDSNKTAYDNIAIFGATEDILGYDPAGHPSWANLLRDKKETCFQEKGDQRGEFLTKTA